MAVPRSAKQALGKRARVLNATNAGKDNRAVAGQDHFDLRPAAQELVHEWAVDGEKRGGPRLEPIQLRKGERRQPLGRNRSGSVDDVARAANALGDGG